MAIDLEQIEHRLEELLAQAGLALDQVHDPAALETLRVKYLGRKGELAKQFGLFKETGLSSEEKARLGEKLNALKQRLEQAFDDHQEKVGSGSSASDLEQDLTLPGYRPFVGRLHPITRTIDEIVAIFRRLGFFVVEGPEIETEYHNFDALNIPPEHPCRWENFDTFYLDQRPGLEESQGAYLLRSHTSPVQIRFMEQQKPPFQIVVPGRVFRPDALDASHSFQFHQVEGLAVGPGITFGDLKGVLAVWAQGLFGSSARLRFRPHFFPFTEPSAEGDLACIFCDGKGCRVCSGKGWLEVLGCGMVHPNVFKSVGYPPGTVGFAFGMGVERIAMLKYGIEDIRAFSENDLRFLEQFP